MGGTNYSDHDYSVRSSSLRSAGYKSAFVHDEDIKTGKAKAAVHPTLDPHGVTIRESRDSAVHPATLPIILANDMTGSMQDVPKVLQAEEPKLMGYFLKDRVSGKRYIRDYYPAIMVMGIDDYHAQRGMGFNKGEGTLQVGQFESGIEIDQNFGDLWFTANGGGNEGENYDIAFYFAARHTDHDHYQKRHKKGFMFVFGDEPIFDRVEAQVVRDVIGDEMLNDISVATILKEVKRKYHVFWGIPKGHENRPGLLSNLKKYIGEEHVRVFGPEKVCEWIVSTVAMVEGVATVDDLINDGVVSERDRSALVKLQAEAVSSTDLDLPEVPGKVSAVERI